MFSEKGKQLILIENFKFGYHKKLAGDVSRWKCVNRRCRAFLKMDGKRDIVLEKRLEHNHAAATESSLLRQKVTNSLKRRAMDCSSERSSDIIREEISRHGDGALVTAVDVKRFHRNLSAAKLRSSLRSPKNMEEIHEIEEVNEMEEVHEMEEVREMEEAHEMEEVHEIEEVHETVEVLHGNGYENTSIVGHCEEELANIESSYQQSPNRSALGNDKQKKPHFQQEQLRFLKPRVTAARSGRDVSGTDSGAPPDVTSDADTNHPGRHDVTIKIEPDDQLDIEHNLSTEDIEDPPKPSIFVTPLNYTPAVEEVTESVGKRPATEELCELQTKIQCLEASLEALKKTPTVTLTPTATLTPTPTRTPSRDSLGEQNGMRYFLLSLLPELETMPEEQIRAFKIKVMMLVDEIKSQSKR
nr:PREDICTED: uncharacterized protein LOC109032143 isoform X2 [Bemisia tabaci]